MKLRKKLLLFFVPMALLLTGLVTWFSKQAVHDVIHTQVLKRVLAQGDALAKVSLLGFKRRSEQEILHHLQNSLEMSDARFLFALDTTGRVLAHTNVAETGKIHHDAQTRMGLESDHPLWRSAYHDNQALLDVSIPVWDISSDETNEDFLWTGQGDTARKSRVGTLRLGIPLDEALETEHRIALWMLLILGASGLMGLTGAWVFMKKILRPIGHLAEGTERISRGEYGMTVPVLSTDELGHLAASFNRMSKELSETSVSKNFLNLIMDDMLDPLIVTERNGIVQMANQAALDLFGTNREELVGRSASTLFAEPENLFTGSLFEILTRQGLVRNLEQNLRAKEGHVVCVQVSATHFMDDLGHHNGFIMVARDMTEQKKMQANMLQQGKLSAVGQLAAGVAHEINNPLGIILGFVQGLIRRMPTGDISLEMPLKSIEREAVRCKNLVQDLLTFSRTSRTEYFPLNINSAVEGILPLIQAEARVKKVEIHQYLANDLPLILGDKNKLQQVIINLANNALDAMPIGGRLTLRTELLRDKIEPWVCLKILDTGAGIPPDVLPRIFEPFYTTKSVGKGTGLGLSLVYEIVKSHAGTIDVASQPNLTEFTLRFPVRSTTSQTLK